MNGHTCAHTQNKNEVESCGANREEEKKNNGLGSAVPNFSELPRSTINVTRVSLSQRVLRDVDIFKQKEVIGQGTFG